MTESSEKNDLSEVPIIPPGKFSITSLEKSVEIDMVIRGSKKAFSLRKIGLDELLRVIHLPTLGIERRKDLILQKIHSSLMNATDYEARRMWFQFTVKLQDMLLTPSFDELLDVELFNKIQLSGYRVSELMLRRYRYARPEETPYSKIYGEFSIEANKEFVDMLLCLPQADQRNALVQLDPKVLYLMEMCELEYFEENEPVRDKETFLTYYQWEHAFAPLLSYLQDNMMDLYEMSMKELLNPEWDYLRNMFYENYRSRKFEDTLGEDNVSLIDELTKI